MKKKWMIPDVLSLAVIVMLAGCGKEEGLPCDVLAEDGNFGEGVSDAAGAGESGDGTEQAQGEQAARVAWQDSHMPLYSHFEEAVLKDNVVYGYYMKEDGAVVVAQNIRTDTVLSEFELQGMTELGNITADAQGNIYVSGAEDFRKISIDGEVTVFDDFLLEDMEDSCFVEPRGIYVDSEGRFYLHYELGLPASLFYEDEMPNVYTMADRIYVKDSQLNTLFYEQIPSSRGSRLLSFSFDEAERPVILAEDEDGAYICSLDLERQELGEKKQLDSLDAQDFAEDVKAAFGESGFVFCMGNELYRYDYDSGAEEKLLNLPSCGILAEDVLYIGLEENGETITIIDNCDNQGDTAFTEGVSSIEGAQSAEGISSMGNSEYVVIAWGEDNKTVLSMGIMMSDRELEKAVADFNRFSGDSRIEVNVYYEEGSGDFERALEQLQLDIVSGRAPDIMEVSMVNTDVLTDKGILADLYEFMDADPEFGRDAVLEPVLKAYEKDGHLYSCGAAFQLHTAWGPEAVFQGRYGIGMEELRQILESQGKDINAIYGFSADEPVMTTLCTFAMDRLIDWDKGECDFSGEYMKGLLEFAAEWEGYREGSLVWGIREGEVLLTIGQITSVADYQMQKELYGGDISFVGYPSAGGTGTALSIYSREFAVNAGSGNRKDAWEFVKYYMKKGYIGLGFPTVKENFDAAMQAAMKDDYVDSIEGTYKEAKSVYTDAEEGIFFVYAASQEDVDKVLELIERAETRYKYSVDIQNIINEEAESYFRGQKDFQAVAEIMESRVGIYLGEQMGSR